MTTEVEIITSDNVHFNVKEELIFQSKLVKDLVADLDTSNMPIPLHNVNSPIFKKVIEYLEHYKDNDPNVSEDEEFIPVLTEWSKEYTSIDNDSLGELYMAANYLDIKGLYNICAKAFADIIKPMTPQQIRDLFELPNEFTPEEEAALDKEAASYDE